MFISGIAEAEGGALHGEPSGQQWLRGRPDGQILWNGCAKLTKYTDWHVSRFF